MGCYKNSYTFSDTFKYFKLFTAARRRAWVRHEDERREDARRAHWAANVLGGGVQGEGTICDMK